MKRHLLLLAVLAAVSSTVSAQEGVSGLLLRFFSPSNPVVLRRNADPTRDHSAHFVSETEAQASLSALNQAIATQLSTVPVASSSSAFAFTFDSSLGVYNRATESFGPSYAERSLTAGKGKFSMGLNTVHSTYDSLDGQSLEDGGITFNLTHIDVNGDHSNLSPWFEGDLIQSKLFMTIENNTTVLFGSYGVTDKFDVSVAVPYVKLKIDATIRASIDHVATAGDAFAVHAFDDGTDSKDFGEHGVASGIGDMLLRGKYAFHRGEKFGAAALLELRLPTGNEEDLLGSGQTQTRLALIVSGSKSRVSPHLNLGYTVASGSGSVVDLPNQLDYVAGFDASLGKRVSLAADILGRTLFDTNELVTETKTYQFDRQTDPTVRTTTRDETSVVTGDVTSLVGVVGLKINPVGRLLITANALFQLNDGGLQDKFTPTIGLEYSF